MKEPMPITTAMRRLAQFIVPIWFALFLATFAGATRPGSQPTPPPGGPSANNGGSPPALQTRPDTYDQWQGEYKGSCDFKFEGRLHENATFVLRITKPVGDGTLGATGGFDTDLRGTVTGVHFEIHLPNDSKKPDDLRISSSELSIKQTRECPFQVEIQKTTNQPGNILLSGSVTGYELRADKGPSQVVVMDVRKFRVMR